VHIPGNGNFTVWDSKQQNVRSACRVLPNTTEEVSEILAIILNEGCNFAVKGGGHARYADDSVSVGGVTIGMVNMRSLEISSDKRVVTVGMCCTASMQVLKSTI
jgi:FAD/FMN-containing dehydrogenase